MSAPGQDGEGRPLRIMPWWLAGLGLLAAIGFGWLVTVWLLGEADRGTTRAELRIDAIRTGLTVVAGTGAGGGAVDRRPAAVARRARPTPPGAGGDAEPAASGPGAGAPGAGRCDQPAA